MIQRDEFQQLRARTRAVDARLSRLSARIAQMKLNAAPVCGKARVNPDKCQGCGICKDICPSGAIVVDSIAKIDESRCLGCRQCVVACPVGAIYNPGTGSTSGPYSTGLNA